MTKPELYRQLRALGFSAEQALAEMNGIDEPVHEVKAERQTVAVAVPNRRGRSGPRMEYLVRPVRKGQKVTVAMGNNTDVYKVLTASKRALTVPEIAKATGISPHSVESSVYQLVSTGLLEKRAITR